jgi:chemotaxis protein methyltransferase CheR
MSLELTPQLFAIFAALAEDTCGIYYSPGDRGLLESKLAAQAAELGYDSLLDYYYRLRYDDPTGEALDQFVQALVVHETYFFRELPALQQLVEHYIAEAIASRGHARVWSAACSTGEEPITLAMLLDQRKLLERVEIVASDISAAAIAKARAGMHGRRSLREGHPEALALKYLDAGPRGVTSAARLREAIRFEVANLLDTERVRSFGQFDVILCRNVLIYFRDEQITKLITTLRSMLVPGGTLAVGVAESLLRFGTGVTCEERGGAFFYRAVR